MWEVVDGRRTWRYNLKNGVSPELHQMNLLNVNRVTRFERDIAAKIRSGRRFSAADVSTHTESNTHVTLMLGPNISVLH